jgi:hypothetical protein
LSIISGSIVRGRIVVLDKIPLIYHKKIHQNVVGI